MTDRERLIELCNEKIRTMTFQNSDHWYDFTVRTEIISDYLLANGVIVPPCKVGDIVYQIMDIKSVHRQVLELKVLRIEITEQTIRFWCRTVKNYRYNFCELDIDDFGKTVFLTKEEAEAKLKESEAE